MARDRELERELFEQAAAPPDLVAQVVARLDHFEAEHGNAGWDQPVDELLAEIEEEAADILGWGVGAARKLDDRQKCRLVAALSDGVKAWTAIRALREEVARAERL